ncbi:primosomal protein DnaI [Pullulanibacillus sp. KACC 23026]|uniref:primosomal protein DnaI n=1 Tax=Pullulanibacillus sp. KACC 23026 TaxID=3028315 RepID=UPI0023B077E7|nr:primosomal protein DnaI [Pullulanibacillus sp. KACC 23026]WEG13915.1 primosomal protein DnaI [Pullulanibacillus sp. KACC 23026]
MESIKQTLNQMLRNQKPEQNMESFRTYVYQDSDVQAFLKAHPESADALLTRYLSKAYEVAEANHNCAACPGLEKCPNVLPGYQPSLVDDKGGITVTYHPCSIKLQVEQQKRQKTLIKSYYVPQKILKATFRTIDSTEQERKVALREAVRFVEHYLQDPQSTKGLYFYGDFGVGKTHIMGAILNTLAERGQVESLMVYTPDFFREIKNSIQDSSVEDKLEYIRTVPLLVLDDIGAETMGPWIRDDVLGSILQRRVMENLPTLFTSNYNLDELEEHLAYSNKSGIELVKAKRLMERIRHYTVAVSLRGRNRRSDI